MRFIVAFIVLVVAASCCHKTKQCEKKMSEEFKYYVWHTMSGDIEKRSEKSQIDSLLSEVKNAGLNGIFVNGTVEDVEKIAARAKHYNIEVHAWVWTLNRPGDATAMKHPEWYSVNRNGQNSLEYNPYVDYYQWLSPFHPEAREYIKKNMESYAKIEGLTSVHLDYVRFCDVILPVGLQPKYNLTQNYEMPEYDYGYHPIAREGYKKMFGIDPMDMKSPSTSSEWRQYRLNAVTSLVNEIATVVHSHNKKLTAAVFPFPEMSRSMVRQEWSYWNLDGVLPMLYNNFYNKDIPWIGFCVKQGVRDINNRFPIYSGVFLPELTPKELKDAIITSKENGAKGISLFSLSALKQEHVEVLKAMKKEINK